MSSDSEQTMEIHHVPSASARTISERQIPTVQEFLTDFNDDDKLTIATSRELHFHSKKKCNM